MTRNTLVLAAAIVAASTLAARADSMIHDSNTGLEARYHYGTLADLQAQGLPISEKARTYLKQHGGARSANTGRGNVYLLEERPVHGAYGAYNSPYTNYSVDDKQRPW